MNRAESDILLSLISRPFLGQRELAERTGLSLGLVNRSLRNLALDGYLGLKNEPTQKAFELCKECSPRNAIILAAGMGMRMAPINVLNPKALLEVHGQPLIERQIAQLHEVGVNDITIVVGFMKEKFDYLIDEYGVSLVVNPDYVHKNSLSSLALVTSRISNTYIVPCDIWSAGNPFAQHELYSWYAVGTQLVADGEVRINRKSELTFVQKGELGNQMIGIAYVCERDAAGIRGRLLDLSANPRYDDCFWEHALRLEGKMALQAKAIASEGVAEVNTYEQLRDLNSGSSHLEPGYVALAADALHVDVDEIRDVTLLKKGVVNSTFRFEAHGARYVMRVPIDLVGSRQRWLRERDALRVVVPLGFCNEPLQYDMTTGIAITPYIETTHPCDPADGHDGAQCIARLRGLHQAGLAVSRVLDPFASLQEYELLWKGAGSVFRDYEVTKERVMSLRHFVMRHASEPCLLHGDPAPDNFLFAGSPDGSSVTKLIDWEYAGMGDPAMDIALLCIAFRYQGERVDQAIGLYHAAEDRPSKLERAKVYCYMAACGLMWSNWCEYEWHQGVEFGEYSLVQYRYAKDYFRKAEELIRELEERLEVA